MLDGRWRLVLDEVPLHTLTAIWPDIGVVPVTWDENGGNADIEVPIRLDAEKWDEFHPKRPPVRLWLKGADIEEYKDLDKLAVIFECAVGNGKLLVSAIDVSKENHVNPVARQLRYSLLNYTSTDCYQPNVPVSPEEMRTLLFDTVIMKKLGATGQTRGICRLFVQSRQKVSDFHSV